MNKLTIVWVRAVLFFAVGTSSATICYGADADFVIRPYLFSQLGAKIGVGWQYTMDPAAAGAQLELYDGPILTATLPAETDGSLNFVLLPLPACGFGPTVSYRVSGQTDLTPISDIPCANSTDPVRFSFMADTQEGVESDRVFASQLKSFPASAVLNGGDLVQTGTSLSDWLGFFSAMDAVGGSRVLFPALGNHEYRHDVTVPYWKHFFRTEAKDAHYAFDLGAAHVIALNSNFEDDPTQRDSQLEWLKGELAIPSQWKIVYFHHPPYSVGYFNSPFAIRKEFVTVRDYYVPLFEQYGVDIVLNGHVHLFETAKKEKVHYLIVGPAGGTMGVVGNIDQYKLKSERVRSMVQLEAAPDHLRAMSVSVDGAVLDDLILRK